LISNQSYAELRAHAYAIPALQAPVILYDRLVVDHFNGIIGACVDTGAAILAQKAQYQEFLVEALYGWKLIHIDLIQAEIPEIECDLRLAEHAHGYGGAARNGAGIGHGIVEIIHQRPSGKHLHQVNSLAPGRT